MMTLGPLFDVKEVIAMTHKRAHYSRRLSVFASVVAVFILVVSLGAPAAIASVPLFLPAVIYDSGGEGATSAVVADVNGDGKPDLLVANFDGSVGVLLGNGDGTFQAAVTYGSGGRPTTSVAVADVNGDAKPDLLVANFDGSVGVLLGNGDGTFQSVVNYASGGFGPMSVAAADVNGDGKADLLVANWSASASGATVGVLLGNGDGTFQPAVTYRSGGVTALSVAVADVNGDGKPDLLVANFWASFQNLIGTVGVLLGNGDGTFQSAVAYATGGTGGPNAGGSVAVADVNGDGKPDLLAANEGNATVGVLLGNGDGTFQPVVTYGSGGSGANSVAVADVNGDGKPDLLVATSLSATVGVLLGNGDGTFQSAVTYGSGGLNRASSVVGADVNGDGRPDLLVGTCNNFSCFVGAVSVLLNNSQPPDTTPPVITLSTTPKILWPPNGRLAPVTLSGAITDTGSGVNTSTAEYAVQDEYGEVQPFGKIALDSAGNYLFTILLRAGRRGNDLNGRQYTIRVSAKDNAGNRGVRWTRVTVPHDQSR
jgi:hypothetical protein